MDRHYRALVIGGGVVGCNVLYHLTREGWSDVALCERRELTAGATWHSSGHISAYTGDLNLVELARYTRSQIDRLRTEVEQGLGLHSAGSLRLATRPAHLAEYRRFANAAQVVGVDARVVGPREALALWPLMNGEGVLGALHLPEDCYLNAADFTQALARAARSRGAQVLRHTEVTGLKTTRSGGWRVRTTNGDIDCEHVVSATGIFARRTFALAGMFLPVATLSHQYLVTEPVGRIVERRRTNDARLPILRQPDIRLNVREEGDGFFASVYESGARAIFPDGAPREYGMEQLPPDIESIEDQFEGAIHRVPCLEEPGIREVVHGPLPWSADFAPLVGPVADRRNLWVAEGVSYGVTWSGGVARLLARWIVHGDPGCDTSSVDCRRFGATATPAWAMVRMADALDNVHFVQRPLIARDIVDDEALDINTAYATTAATAKPIITTFFKSASLEKAIALYDLSAGGDGDGIRFRRRPFASTTCTVVVSPLRFSPESLRVADTAVRNGVPLKVSTVSQAGATGPVSLAGNIALGNAEVLAGYVALNLLRPGCRLLYGNWPFVSDLRTGAFVGGGGEMALQMSGSAQLARHYDLPSTVAAAMTSAKVSDAQSGWEKGYLSTLPALAGANMIMMAMGGLADNVGYSPEALVIDESMLSGVLRSVRGVEVDDRTLAMESIERAIHGEGHFLGDGLTLEMMQSEFVYPKLADRQSIDAWLESGAPDIRGRAREIAREILARHYPTHIDAGDDARIRARFSILLPPEAMRPAP